MVINISYLNTPLEGDDLKLNENMWITAKPYYKNKNIKFEELHRMVSSDYRQYSPFFFKDKTKKSENWNNDNQNILILDIDDGQTLEDGIETFKEFKSFSVSEDIIKENNKIEEGWFLKNIKLNEEYVACVVLQK